MATKRQRSRGFGMWGVLIGMLMLFGTCLLVTGLAMQIYARRTKPVSDFGLTIPTSPPTLALESGDGAVPQAAATLTIAPTVTPLGLSAESIFTINRTDVDLFSAETSAWSDIAGISPSHIVEQEATWNGSNDLTALWKLAYDAQFLYGFVNVQDDVIAQTQTPRTAYLGDSLELEIDTQNNKSARALTDDYQFIISPGNFADVASGIYRFRGNNEVMADDVGDIAAAVIAKQTTDGYILHFRIPWSDMRLSSPPAELGIALNINDNDLPGTPQQELMLSNVSNRRWSQPVTWGTVSLSE